MKAYTTLHDSVVHFCMLPFVMNCFGVIIKLIIYCCVFKDSVAIEFDDISGDILKKIMSWCKFFEGIAINKQHQKLMPVLE